MKQQQQKAANKMRDTRDMRVKAMFSFLVFSLSFFHFVWLKK